MIYLQREINADSDIQLWFITIVLVPIFIHFDEHSNAISSIKI